MPRGKPAHRGRGAARTPAINREFVARPSVKELPTGFQLRIQSTDIPSPVRDAFPEFKQAQPYFSALEKLAPEFAHSAEHRSTCWLGAPDIASVSRNDTDDSGFLADLEFSNGNRAPIFVKRIHLLDPLSTMEGEYVLPSDGALPAPSELWKTALAKINDPLNEAYVDAIYANVASKFVESGLSPHWCKCYGTYTARVDKYLYNISEEYDSLKQKPWWRRNQRNGLFTLHRTEQDKINDQRFFTEGLSEIDVSDFAEIPTLAPELQTSGFDSCGSGDNEVECVEPQHHKSSPVKLHAPKVHLERMPSPADSTGSGGGFSASSDDGEYSEDEIQQFAEFTNFPVQVTLLEYADGTMDELIDEEDDADETLAATKEQRWGAWLFQVIAALAAAQYWTGFVHNDLHTNNVMWSGTGQTHIYYRVHKGKEVYYMCVPTYGRIMKIIDFGRASYTLPEPAGFFISDAFYPGNDAMDQYNCEPFYDPDEKKLEPNTSFDLCRLAVSLLESLYPDRPEAAKPTKIMSREGGKLYTETSSAVYNMLWEWLTDDEGKNILRTPDGEERYPDFDLYHAIAADAHRAIPKRQIERALFTGYRVLAKEVPTGESVYDLYI